MQIKKQPSKYFFYLKKNAPKKNGKVVIMRSKRQAGKRPRLFAKRRN